MLLLCVCHLATSPPHHLPPLPRLLLRSLIQQICSEMYGCSSNKTHSALGAKDVGLHWTRHSAAHWPPGPFSAHTKEPWTKTLKAGAAPQRKHLLVIVFDCIMKMMFFFNLGLLRPHYFPLVTWLLYWSSPSLALWGAEGENIENGPKASPLFTLTPLVFRVFSRKKT